MTSPDRDYFNTLDTLRFFAFFAVFANHAASFLRYPKTALIPHHPFFAYLQIGDLGVGFFFVLSGFLITYLLEKERNKTGRISLRNFYIRRVLRIWPLYFLAIAIIVIISYLFHGFNLYQTGVNWNEIVHHFFFVGNIYRAFQHTSNEMIAILWSIAVEEQFYLVWPILFILFRKYIHYVLILGIIISMFFRYHFANQFEIREFYTPCVMIYLLVGALIGLYGNKLKGFIERRKSLLTSLSVLGILSLLSVRGLIYGFSYPPLFIALDGLLFAICFALIILSAVYGWGSNKLMIQNEKRPMTEYLGTISYGLYVYHLIALTILIYIAKVAGFDYENMNPVKFFSLSGCTLLLTVLLASLSYRWIEKPFLALKEKFVHRALDQK